MKLEFQMWIGVPETVEVEEPDRQMSFDFAAGLQDDCNKAVDE